MTGLPLSGVRVLQFGQMVTAPMIGTHLADWGAEVIKIETNARIDKIRMLLTLKPGMSMEDMMNSGSQFNEWNRGAISIQANIKNPEAVKIMLKLAKKSDVIIENYSPHVMKGLGLGYEDFKKANPKIIMVSASALGQEGPYSEVITYGAIISSLTGFQSLRGYPDGEAAQDYGIADYYCGNMAAFLIKCALRHRNKTGEGQYIDMGQAAPMVLGLGEPMMDFVMNKRVAKMAGNQRTGFCPHNAYRCRPNPSIELLPPDDQWVIISVETDKEWQSLCNAMGNPAWTKDAKFADYNSRWNNQEEMDELITRWTVTMDKYEVFALLQAAGVAAAPFILQMEKEHISQNVAREVYKTKDWPTAKGVLEKFRGSMISGLEPRFDPGPVFGGANDYVYGELLGLSKDEIQHLKDEKVIF